MPLSKIQIAVLRLLAALSDAAVLEAAGYRVEWLRQLPVIYTAAVTKDDAGTRLEWVADSDFRFFPTIRDELFGYILHPADLAANKVMAAAGRRELRDIVDLVTVHETILPLGAVVWAAVEKSPGFTPEGLIAEIRRNMHHPAMELLALDSSEPLHPKDITARLRAALDDAGEFVAKMPTEKSGMLFLKDGHVAALQKAAGRVAIMRPTPHCAPPHRLIASTAWARRKSSTAASSSSPPLPPQL